MNFKTHNDTGPREKVYAVGTCLQGYVDIDYDELVEYFGEPLGGDGYKIDAVWLIVFEDGTPATIYNYKDGPNYLGEDAGQWTDSWANIKDKNREWHIGGTSQKAVQLVLEALELS